MHYFADGSHIDYKSPYWKYYNPHGELINSITAVELRKYIGKDNYDYDDLRTFFLGVTIQENPDEEPLEL